MGHGRQIVHLYCDASYSCRTGAGGIAVVVPSWCARPPHVAGIRTFRDGKHTVYCAHCMCSDSRDAEKRALGLAVLAACEILKAHNGIRTEILSDCLPLLDSITLNAELDPIISAVSHLRQTAGIIISKIKAHNGSAGNELADKWAKYSRHKAEEELHTMRMPYRDSTSGGVNPRMNSGTRSNPFDGAAEMDIRSLTERVLNDENNIGYVTSEGKVMPRNMAFRSGSRNGTELVKKRVWGCEDSPVEIVYSDEALARIAAESMNSPDRETGGALIGSWQRDSDGFITVNVERATGPGTEAVRSAGMFSPHMEYYRSRVDWYRETEGWDYLGEWHKHPGDFDSLSGTDINTARGIISTEGWPMLLLPIVNRTAGGFVMENNLILSPQLGGGILSHTGTVELSEPPGEKPDVTAYLSMSDVDDFLASGEDSRIIRGTYNKNESYIFLDTPGIKNSAAKFMKDSGENLPVCGIEGVLTVIVGTEGVRCWHSCEGEIQAVKSVIIDPENSIYERNAGLTETTELRDKTITLIGCGSLGATMALSLARAGAGHFRLFDPDRLSPVNIARHQAGLVHLGRNKACVVRDLILGLNPSLDAEAFPYDIVNSEEGYNEFMRCAGESSIIVCTTDTDDSRMLVNDYAVKNGIKAVQAGLHERAASGIVHVYEPDSEEACFACHRNTILSESGKRNETVAYSEAADVRDLTIQPGLSAQINVVAETAALRTIDALMGRRSLPSLTVIYY